MSKNIVRRVDINLARRLREARRESGWSTRAVAARLPKRFAVSHATIASYENGVTVPPIDFLSAIGALYGRPINWFLEERDSLSDFRYRNLKSRVLLSEKRQFEALAGKWADAYLNLDRFLATSSPPVRRFRSLDLDKEIPPQDFAVIVRRKLLNLDDKQPVQSVVGALEEFSARAIEIKAGFDVDGASARHGENVVVVVNPEIANERVRMNAAHELAHLLYGRIHQKLKLSDADLEDRAYRFASSILIPMTQLREAFKDSSFIRLIQYKERFGVSLVAMIYMAEQNGVINSSASRKLWGEIARRGWRQNEPGFVWRDRAIRFEMMLESAIQTKELSWIDAERVTGVRELDLRKRLSDVIRVDVQLDNATAQNTIKFREGM